MNKALLFTIASLPSLASGFLFKRGPRTYEITVTNIAFNQPMGVGFFVAVHDDSAEPVFRLGMNATEELALLAENGDTTPLVDKYTDATGVDAAFSAGDAPIFAGESLTFEVEVSPQYPYVSFASMCISTNDCFVGVDSLELWQDMILFSPGYDAGSEENNELCNSIPGPACMDIDTSNERSGNGEGPVHIHRGFFGIGDLPADRYDWRNPMLKIEVKNV